MSPNACNPAYPVPLNPGESYSQHSPADGLTKRELFAAMAMQGMCAHHATWHEGPEGIAVQAARVADALLAELAKDGTP